jgi:hypothetical protein
MSEELMREDDIRTTFRTTVTLLDKITSLSEKLGKQNERIASLEYRESGIENPSGKSYVTKEHDIVSRASVESDATFLPEKLNKFNECVRALEESREPEPVESSVQGHATGKHDFTSCASAKSEGCDSKTGK